MVGACSVIVIGPLRAGVLIFAVAPVTFTAARPFRPRHVIDGCTEALVSGLTRQAPSDPCRRIIPFRAQHRVNCGVSALVACRTDGTIRRAAAAAVIAWGTLSHATNGSVAEVPFLTDLARLLSPESKATRGTLSSGEGDGIGTEISGGARSAHGLPSQAVPPIRASVLHVLIGVRASLASRTGSALRLTASAVIPSATGKLSIR